MIKNERQYRITLLLVKKFRAAIRELSSQPVGDFLMRKLEVDALISQVEELEREARVFSAGLN